MKKSKFIAAAIATTMFATAACGLIACDKDAGGLGTQDPVKPTPTGKAYTITFNVGVGETLKGIASGNTLKTGTDGKLTGTMPEADKADSTFLGWTLTSGSKTAEITKTTYTSKVFTKNTDVYAVFAPNGGGGGGGGGGGTENDGVHTITFYVGSFGSMSLVPNTMQTTGGKLTSLPAVNPNTDYRFDGWFTADQGGNQVELGNSYNSFTADTPLYAHYTYTGGGGGGGGGEVTTDPTHSTNGLYSGDTLLGALDINGGDTPGRKEYWFGDGVRVYLTQGDTVSFYIDGALVTNIYTPEGIVGDGSGDNPSSVFTVQATGKYKVFLKLWDDSGNYNVEFAKDADVGNVTNLPSESCKVTISDGSTSIVLYFVDANGTPVTLGNYKIWAWCGGDNVLAADWGNRPTMSANVTAIKSLGDTINFKITEGNNESNNLEGITTGKTYVVTIGANNQLTIEEYVG